MPDVQTSSHDAALDELLPLIHPSIEQASSEPRIFLHRSTSRSKEDLMIAYVSSNPQAFLNYKAHAWSSAPDLPLEVWKKSLEWAKRWVLVRLGIEAKQHQFGDDIVVEASNEASLMLFVDMLSMTKAHDLPMVVQHLVQGARSSTSVFHGDSVGGPNTECPSTISFEVMVQNGSPRQVQISSADELARILLGSLMQGNSKSPWLVHLAFLNGLSQLEIYTLLGSVHKAFQSMQAQIAQVSWSTFSKSPLEQLGLSLAVIDIPQSPDRPISNSVAGRSHEKFCPQIYPKSASPVTNPSIKVPTSANVIDMIRKGCRELIAVEPQVTEFDTITGDGDCGYTLAHGAQSVLELLPMLDFANLAAAMDSVGESLQKSMGGTSGALYCIFISSLSHQLTKQDHTDFASALTAAYQDLLTYTPARPGDRTCIDALAPFVITLSRGGSARDAADAAQRGADETRKMVPKLGRSTYLDEKDCEEIPDPGAWALARLLHGLCEFDEIATTAF